MTNQDYLIRRQVLLVILMWCASALPVTATEPGPDRTKLSTGGRVTGFGAYAVEVQSGIKEALLRNNTTRTASISGVRIRIWVDKRGRVTRAQLVDTTGSPSLDSVITDQVLTGLQLKEPPPADMPMPIVLRVSMQAQSPFGGYASQVRSRIVEALLQNSKTRDALIVDVPIRIWIDSNGRVTRSQLAVSTNNPSLDSAITDEVLTGLQLKEPPPADMPMPIVLRVSTHPSS